MKKKITKKTTSSGTIKGKNKVNPKLTELGVFNMMDEIEKKMMFDGIIFNTVGGLEGCVEGFDYFLKKLDVVLQELEDLYDKSEGFKGMTYLKKLYDDLVSKTECFIEDVSDLRCECNLESREELMDKCIKSLFYLRVSSYELSENVVKKYTCFSDLKSFIKTCEMIVGETILIKEFDGVYDYELSPEVQEFVDKSSMKLVNLRNQIKNLSEELDKPTSKDDDNYFIIKSENERFENFYSFLYRLISDIEILLKTEETRCSEIEYEWDQLYPRYSDSLVDDFDDNL